MKSIKVVFYHLSVPYGEANFVAYDLASLIGVSWCKGFLEVTASAL